MSYFTKDTVKFFRQLHKNNSKEWFEKHREDFELHVMEPAKVFVMHMGDSLKEISPAVNAVPKTDKSIFRLHRDVRFSKNKAPYKTNLGIYFWEGSGKKMECSGYYMHIEPGLFFVGAGMYMFSPVQIKTFRKVVYNPDKAKELLDIIKKIENKGYSINETYYKQVPRGFDKEYKFADLLKYNGLYAYYESTDINELLEADQIKFLYKKYKDMKPLHEWMVKNIV